MPRYCWKRLPGSLLLYNPAAEARLSGINFTFAGMSVFVKVINKSAYPLPEYATPDAAGMDLRANIETAVSLEPMERILVPTGLFIELPRGYEAQIRPRSGLAIKQGLTLLNAPGTVDADYRGEIKIILANLSGEKQVIHPGDRIAQMIIARFERAGWEEVASLTVSSRGEGGFGHTGKK